MGREEASVIAQALMNLQIFAHLGSAADFSDDETLYRLLDDDEGTIVLNRQVLWHELPARSACAVSQDLLRRAIRLARSAGTRDFEAVREFQERVCELQMVNLIQLPVDELRTFFINIFNVLVLHARMTARAPPDEDIAPRCAFFRNTCYQVGKYFYSLDDVGRGILRAKKCSFLRCDPRVHFALSLGTATSPPVRVYSSDALDPELEAAARAFCSERVRVDTARGDVTLPRLFSWYRRDFGESPAELLAWVRRFVPASVAAQVAQAAQRRDVRILFE